MADVLQQHGWDTTRALCESGGDGPVDREWIVNTGGGDTSKIEAVCEISGTARHWPSEERLATAISGFSTAEAIDAGAEIIGVNDNSWTYITGDCSLQDTLQSIDDHLATVGLADDYLAKDGSVSPTGNFDWAGYDISNVGALEIDTSITMTDDAWIGLGGSAGRIIFLDEATDGIQFEDCNVGIGAAPTARLLEIHGSSGIMRLVDVNSAVSSIVCYTEIGTSSGGWDRAAYYGMATADDVFRIWCEEATGSFEIGTANTSAFIIDSSHNVIINDSAADSNMAVGLTIQQGGADDLILALQNSDVDHPFTDFADAETYFSIKKYDADSGGALLHGYSEDFGAVPGVAIYGSMGESSGSGSVAVIHLNAAVTDLGTGRTVVPTAMLVLELYNDTRSLLEIDAEGVMLLADWVTEGNSPELKISGYRTGDVKRTLEIGVGVDAANTASFDGLANYWFDGAVEATGNLKTGGTLEADGHAGFGTLAPNDQYGIWANFTDLTTVSPTVCSLDATFPSTATTSATVLSLFGDTQATAFTCANFYQLRVWSATAGSGSTITNCHGIKVEDVDAGTNNWAIKTGAGTVEFGGSYVTFKDNVYLGPASQAPSVQVEASGKWVFRYDAQLNAGCKFYCRDANTYLWDDGTDFELVTNGVLKFGTHAAIGSETVTGYITIKDSAGNSRKLAVVS